MGRYGHDVCPVVKAPASEKRRLLTQMPFPAVGSSSSLHLQPSKLVQLRAQKRQRWQEQAPHRVSCTARRPDPVSPRHLAGRPASWVQAARICAVLLPKTLMRVLKTDKRIHPHIIKTRCRLRRRSSGSLINRTKCRLRCQVRRLSNTCGGLIVTSP